MKKFLSVLLLISFAFIFGCADLDTPTPESVIKDPLGSSKGISIGMTKAQVIGQYGEPDMKDMVTSSEWGGPREEWFYRGRYSALPVSAGYLKEDMYLYFDGENLTNISKKKLGRSEGEMTSDEIIK